MQGKGGKDEMKRRDLSSRPKLSFFSLLMILIWEGRKKEVESEEKKEGKKPRCDAAMSTKSKTNRKRNEKRHPRRKRHREILL